MDKNYIKNSINELGFKTFFTKYRNKKDIVEKLWNYPFPYDKLSEIFYVIYHDIDPPVCNKGNKKSFIDFSKGYKETTCFLTKDNNCYCLTAFRKNKAKKIHENFTDEEKENLKEKRNTTILKKYGVTNVFSNKDIQEKIKQTNLEKYGVDNPTKSKSIKDKIKQTNIDKYGVIHPAKTEKFQSKRKNSLLKRYGVTETFYSSSIKEKINNKLIKKYGVNNPFKNKDIQEKIKQTNLEKYGSENIGSRNLSEETKEIINNKEKFINFSKNKSFELVAKELNMSATRIAEISRKHDCISTMNIGYGSSDQTILNNFLRTLEIKTETNTRHIIKPKEIDIFLPDYNLGIEYNGLYWHTEFTGGKDKNYHKNKLLECNKQGIDLIQIFSDEWINKQDIVKSIIKSKLGLNNRIYARKTEIKEISEKESKLFLENNHLQGNVIGSNKRYGLYYNNELISVMTFQLKNNVWELKRFSNKININVIGGASKLFKYFIKENSPKEIFSYCDLRYFNGKIYESLGFTYDKTTQPGYFYVKNSQRYHRLNFTKKKLIEMGYDSKKTEFEIMTELGYDRIWDCGHSKWIWKSI